VHRPHDNAAAGARVGGGPGIYVGLFVRILNKLKALPACVGPVELARIEVAALALDVGGRLRNDQVEDLRALSERDLGMVTRECRALKCLCAAMAAQGMWLDSEAASGVRRCEEILDELY
jgi:hypothetical protein